MPTLLWPPAYVVWERLVVRAARRLSARGGNGFCVPPHGYMVTGHHDINLSSTPRLDAHTIWCLKTKFDDGEELLVHDGAMPC